MKKNTRSLLSFEFYLVADGHGKDGAGAERNLGRKIEIDLGGGQAILTQEALQGWETDTRQRVLAANVAQ